MMEEMFMGKATAFTSRADRLLEGAKRIAAERRKPVKKATDVKLELLRKAVHRYITPYAGQIHKADLFKLRTIF
jgi:uracil-DNA glycosylase